MKIRTRFAPSPTGYMHIGNLRTALYEYLIAKSQGGDFILRIEDTDQKRYVEGATDIIYNTLKTVNLNWDEGPDMGGKFGPYVQSERKDIYAKYAHELVKLGGAHYCFCSEESADSQKDDEKNMKFTDPCRNVSLEEAQKRIGSGEAFVIRQTINKTGKSKFNDEVYGEIEIDYDELDEGVLLKSDGLPTYNFANVVDDHLMEITHVVRGNEYITSTPKYNLIYDIFGWEKPIYVHVAHIMKDAHSKLSKRNGDASFQDLLAKGYLPEAILNYIALLGWNPGGEEEFFSLEDLTKVFSAKRISKSPAIFDIVKLNWMNGQYIRNMSVEEFHNKVKGFYSPIADKGYNLAELSRVLQPRVETLNEVENHLDYIAELPDYSTELFINKKMKTDAEIAKIALSEAVKVLESVDSWTHDGLFEDLKALAAKLEMKNGQIMYPIRIALSGKETTAGGATDLAIILGKDETLRRVKIAIEKL